ncbi:MAG: preprotein translocase subunit SecE [Flavobacteriales bacterium]|nr:preprotein translocase subunit SecE [Flavobacteriales bacterium]
MEKLTVYLKEVFVELKEKTTWPTFKQLQKDSFLVLGASIVFALMIKVMNLGFHKVMDLIYNL